MFVPDDSVAEGFSVKEPLASFLAKFKGAVPPAHGNGNEAGRSIMGSYGDAMASTEGR